MPASQAEQLNNAIAAKMHPKGSPLDLLAADWVQWWNNDRLALEAGGVLTSPIWFGQLLGYWQRYKAAWEKQGRPAYATPPDDVRPRAAGVVNDEMRRVIEANADVARSAAKGISEVATASVPWLMLLAIAALYFYFGGGRSRD